MKKERLHYHWNFWKAGQEDNKQVVDLPHDAMILEARDPQLENGSGSGYYPGGKYYYSKKIYG